MAKVSPRLPWRNGAGWTTVLAQSGGGEPIEWRISRAEIAQDAAFSDFSGYDRTIVAEDHAFTLEFAGGETVRVEPLVPLRFGGERPVFCRLHGPGATAFNVMTLRGAFEHDVRIRDGTIEVALTDVLSDGPDVDTSERFEDWECARREFATWESLVNLRFAQNVEDERAQEASRALARLAPLAAKRDASMKRRLLEDAASLERDLGAHAVVRWRHDLLAFDPAMRAHAERESDLYAEYTRLLAGARYNLRGTELSAAAAGALTRHGDRDIRREATALIWRFHDENAGTIDRIFDDLVRCRTAMARAAGYRSYTDLAYPRLGRTDYGREDVARLREQIREHIVPLCARIVEEQARALGIGAVMPWDERVFDADDPPLTAPGDAHATLEALERAFSAAHPSLGAFARLARTREWFDVGTRRGKRSGAFCSYFHSLQMPHVFVHFTGVAADVGSLVHELGHAFQDYSARSQPVMEYVVPPAETGELFSLGLEYLLWPHYEAFFGDGADRYRRQHLRTMLLMLPYIAAIDRFQELVYDSPAASPDERYTMWRRTAQEYLPYRGTGGVPHLERGGAWQRQHHVFGFPFYYIDYALALFAAFDLLRASRSDRTATMERYVEVAACGGRLPFRRLQTHYGVTDPFEPSSVRAITDFINTTPEMLTTPNR